MLLHFTLHMTPFNFQGLHTRYLSSFGMFGTKSLVISYTFFSSPRTGGISTRLSFYSAFDVGILICVVACQFKEPIGRIARKHPNKKKYCNRNEDCYCSRSRNTTIINLTKNARNNNLRNPQLMPDRN